MTGNKNTISREGKRPKCLRVCHNEDACCSKRKCHLSSAWCRANHLFFCEDYLTKIKKKRRGGGERERIEHEINADNESGKTVTKNKIKGGLSSGGEE